ncbi:putative metal-dependent hydrolase [Fibrella sp. HMF5335]|uniref:Metal-dependent hydrolase n=1 Tax=Fibrella rubiginis TaxID=2817060 RepID=A0A939GF16_9BACT|nr:putative metal-dependent hydrolase [Fibrella rubiginis]MBO0935238.1 putative metal-dependent hydrolase [Fibrella rubiginis]
MQADDARQFPIGRWAGQAHFSAAEITDRIAQLRELPRQYRSLTESLSDDELSRVYRPGSWTIRQLVHHVADTHGWHYYRIKHALTLPETAPGILSTVNDWAAQPDGHDAPVAPSLAIIDGLHERLAYLYEHLTETDLQKAYYHPFRQIDVSLAQAIDMVVWHGQHHLAHIRLAIGKGGME